MVDKERLYSNGTGEKLCWYDRYMYMKWNILECGKSERHGGMIPSGSVTPLISLLWNTIEVCVNPLEEWYYAGVKTVVLVSATDKCAICLKWHEILFRYKVNKNSHCFFVENFYFLISCDLYFCCQLSVFCYNNLCCRLGREVRGMPARPPSWLRAAR